MSGIFAARPRPALAGVRRTARAVPGLALVGMSGLGLLVLIALCAPWLAPHDPRLPAGAAFAAPGPGHPLGTNGTGQDVASRLVWGARHVLTVAVVATGTGVAIGVLLGPLAGLVGGRVDVVVMRLVDIVVAIPRLPLLILIGAMTAASAVGIALVLGLLAWAPVTRVLRTRALVLRTSGYLRASWGFGAAPLHLLRHHVLPAMAPVVLAEALLVAQHAVLAEAGLAFLGIADPTALSWGLDLHRALVEPGLYFTPAWTWAALPFGAAISLVLGVFALTAIGWEPRLLPRAGALT